MDFRLAAILDQPKKYMSGKATNQALEPNRDKFGLAILDVVLFVGS
jgi:hypothetical protein